MKQISSFVKSLARAVQKDKNFSINISKTSNIETAATFGNITSVQSLNGYINPDIFDGTGSIETHLRLFENTTNHNGWTFKKKVVFLATELCGKLEKLELDSISELVFNDHTTSNGNFKRNSSPKN